jgi:CCR4-NOT transcription complex subunit 9
MTSLLQEIISVYNLLSPSQLTAAASNRVCNALALLQCVASHNETRTLFLSGKRGCITRPNSSLLRRVS